MMKAAQALSQWFAQFGLPVYLDGDVPDDAEAPYITIPLREPNWNGRAAFQFTVWYHTVSNVEPITKADEIIGVIMQGTRIPFDGGLLVLRMDEDTPQAQIIIDEDYRGARISTVLNSYHMPGE